MTTENEAANEARFDGSALNAWLGNKKNRPVAVFVSAYDPFGDKFVGGFGVKYDVEMAANGKYTIQIAKLLPHWKKLYCQMRTPYVKVGFMWRGGFCTGDINECFSA